MSQSPVTMDSSRLDLSSTRSSFTSEQEDDVFNTGFNYNEDDDLLVQFVKKEGHTRSEVSASNSPGATIDLTRSQSSESRSPGPCIDIEKTPTGVTMTTELHIDPVKQQSGVSLTMNAHISPARSRPNVSIATELISRPSCRYQGQNFNSVPPVSQPQFHHLQIHQGGWDLNNNVQYPYGQYGQGYHGYQYPWWAQVPNYVTGHATQWRDMHGAGRYRYHSQIPGLPLPGVTHSYYRPGDVHTPCPGGYVPVDYVYTRTRTVKSPQNGPHGVSHAPQTHENLTADHTRDSPSVIVIEPIQEGHEIKSEPGCNVEVIVNGCVKCEDTEVDSSSRTQSDDLVAPSSFGMMTNEENCKQSDCHGESSPAAVTGKHITESCGSQVTDGSRSLILKIKSDDGGFPCRFCGESFSRKPLLAIHEVLHTVKCKNEPSPTSVKVNCKPETSLTSVKDNNSVRVTKSQKRTADCDLLPPGKRFRGNPIGELVILDKPDFQSIKSEFDTKTADFSAKRRIPRGRKPKTRRPLVMKFVKDRNTDIYSVKRL